MPNWLNNSYLNLPQILYREGYQFIYLLQLDYYNIIITMMSLLFEMCHLLILLILFIIILLLNYYFVSFWYFIYAICIFYYIKFCSIEIQVKLSKSSLDLS